MGSRCRSETFFWYDGISTSRWNVSKGMSYYSQQSDTPDHEMDLMSAMYWSIFDATPSSVNKPGLPEKPQLAHAYSRDQSNRLTREDESRQVVGSRKADQVLSFRSRR